MPTTSTNFTDADVLQELAEIIAKDKYEKELHDLLVKGGHPSEWIKQGYAYHSGLETFQQTVGYYQGFQNAGYSKAQSIVGATAAGLTYAWVKRITGLGVAYNARTITTGLTFAALGAVEGAQVGALAGGIAGGAAAAGVGAVPGGVAGAGIGAVIGSGPGLLMATEGLLMMGASAAVSVSADKLGEMAGLGAIKATEAGTCLKPIRDTILGVISRPSLDSNEFLYSTIDYYFSSKQKQNEFIASIQQESSLSAVEKRSILHDFKKQVSINTFLGNVLGTDATKVPPHGVALLMRPEDAYVLGGANAIIPKTVNGTTTFEYNIVIAGFPVAQDSAKGKRIQEQLLAQNGLLQPDGQFNQALLWSELNDNYSAMNSKMDIFGEKLDGMDKKLDSVIEQMAQGFQLTKEQKKNLMTALNQGLVYKAADGKVYTVAEMVGSLYNDKLAKDKAALDQAKYENDIGKARSFAALGTLIGSPKMEKYGLMAECIIQMAYAVPRMANGDFTAVASFLTACITLKGLFKKEKAIDPHQMIMQSLHNLSLQIEDLKTTVINISLDLQAQLDSILRQMLEGFRFVYADIYISRLLTMKKLEGIQSSIHQLSIQINKQIYGLWLKDLSDAQFNVSNYKTRYGSLANVSLGENNYNKMEDIANTLVHWCTEKASHLNSVGAALYYKNCSPDKTLLVLKSADPEDIMGFLMLYIVEEMPFMPEDLKEDIFNPHIWVQAATVFMDLITGLDQEKFYGKYDPKGGVYKNILLSGTKILESFQRIHKDATVLVSLLNNYAFLIGTSLPLLFKGLVETKSIQEKSIAIKNAELSEKEKITSRLQTFHVNCAKEVHPHENDDYFLQIHFVVNHWNNTIAGQVVPDFFSAYLNRLNSEIELRADLPLKRFHVASNDFLLPLSVLFQNNESLEQPLQLPQELLLAEKLDHGEFVFEMPILNVHHVGGKQNDGDNVRLHTIDFDVIISFKLASGTIPVATVTLHVDANAHDKAVYEIKQAMTINSTYGDRVHDFYTNARETLAKVVLLSAWLNAKVTKITLIFDKHSEIMKNVMNELNQNALVYVNDIANEIEQRTPRVLAGVSEEIYVAQFEAFLLCLDNLDVTHELLLAIGHLAGLPEELNNKLKKLWRTESIKSLISCLNPSIVEVSTVDSKKEVVETPDNPFACCDRFNAWINEHLSSDSSENVLPIVGIAYKDVVKSIQLYLSNAAQRPYVSHNLLETGIINLLEVMVSKNTLNALGITLEEDWINESLPWHRKDALIIMEETFNIEEFLLEYTHDAIEKILVYTYELPDSKIPIRVLPTFQPDAPVFSKTYADIFKENIKATLQEHLKTGVRILQPLLLPYAEKGVKKYFWMLSIIIYDALQEKAVVLFLDSQKNEKNEKSLDLTHDHKKVESIRNAYLRSVIYGIGAAVGPKMLQQGSILFLSQCDNFQDVNNCGLYLLLNAENFMTQKAFVRSLTKTEISMHTEKYRVLLAKINETHPGLMAKPADFDLDNLYSVPAALSPVKGKGKNPSQPQEEKVEQVAEASSSSSGYPAPRTTFGRRS